ncbi:putative procollagen-lysine 5-dioxygenase [Rosa chinensis]|uniref:Putative procollagen-lysine 5-dioxygenase n=1 Tax=Rosa chinensis TaxID=74649 RepID=A0A2P6PIM2_ROSCH|nr:putative procollagen-lysine 5-dioxygenase [Rosa chinensis]
MHGLQGLTGLADAWAARRTWTLDHLLQNYGDTAFKISQSSSRKISMTFKDYVSYMKVQHDEDPFYIFDYKILTWSLCFGEVEPGLLKDNCVPYLFQEDLFDVLDKDERPPFRWLIIGPLRSGASWHVDPALTSAWNTLLCGHKSIFVVKAPAVLLLTCTLAGHICSFVRKVNDWVYFGLLSFSLFRSSPQSPLPHTKRRNPSSFGMLICCMLIHSPLSVWWTLYLPGRVPIGVTVHVNEEDGDVNIETPTSLPWWLDFYPLLADEEKPIECTQMPGETIFVPSVLNLEPSIAVTQNFVNSKNFEFVCLDMAPKYCHKGVCRAGLLADDEGSIEDSTNHILYGKDDYNSSDMTRKVKRVRTLKPGEYPSNERTPMYLDEDRDHYNSPWSSGNCIGQQEIREWLFKLWVGKPGMKHSIWKVFFLLPYSLAFQIG